ncbi:MULTISPECIES: amino-acid N-acetyltransferase [Nocardiopsis]|uniref:Amino-acid N-acetyltransferase n=2 Tax=Nocardiopsis alba TaxID=53437 RepID=A0A7K2ITW3_9ACTN|nr:MULTISPECIES: amino-acid N-acetyltransferase [Nocardiopsis]AFR09689.1 acetyltransferase family protein [Nocardiopsis alba ATCC BAA-2165]MEC3893825.1 amino-acid N-acetyltransferase [Nocardiopsis sp. LDBS1602]MYR33408.1 amino-acid N-acetyltransferase [Nocardiopsis alba]
MPVRHVRVRRARTPDVTHIRRLVDTYSVDRRVLSKSTVNLYEDIQEFWVAEAEIVPETPEGAPVEEAVRSVVGCGALHVLWEDLAEVRTVAVDPSLRGFGVGHRIVTALLDTARELGVRRVFCLTFETGFFARHGFAPIQGTPVSFRVYEELLRSYDEGVAEFLDLERVKPNTLGNTRMLLHLDVESRGVSK